MPREIARHVQRGEEHDACPGRSKGLFDESVRVDHAVTLLGACLLDTRIAPSIIGPEPAALTLRAAAVVRNVQVGGVTAGIDVAEVGDPAELDSVAVRQATGAGIIVGAGGTLTAGDIVVGDTAAYDGDSGRGLELSAGGALDHQMLVK